MSSATHFLRGCLCLHGSEAAAAALASQHALMLRRLRIVACGGMGRGSPEKRTRAEVTPIALACPLACVPLVAQLSCSAFKILEGATFTHAHIERSLSVCAFFEPSSRAFSLNVFFALPRAPQVLAEQVRLAEAAARDSNPLRPLVPPELRRAEVIACVCEI